MKKRIFFFILTVAFLLLTGCTNNVPVSFDIDATIQAAIATAMKDSEPLSQEVLDYSQNLQSTQIAADVDRKISQAIAEAKQSGELVSESLITPTPTLSVSSGSSENCTNKFAFVSDVTFPDGTMTLPYTTFTKSWYIQNIGTCTWNSGYKIVYYSGDKQGTAESFPLFSSDKITKTGESVVASVKLYAGESQDKTYTTYWAMQSDDGEVFNGGESQNIPLSSKFVVGSEYNFYENLAGAICSDDDGYFYCGSSDRSSGRGVAFYEGSPTVESNYAGQPAIVIGTPLTEGGTTRVSFGPVQVPLGTWLRASISCRPNAPLCNANVRLLVQVEGQTTQQVTETQEFNDGFTTEWNVELSDYGYHDQSLTYTFEVEAIGGGDLDDLIVIQLPRLTDQSPQL